MKQLLRLKHWQIFSLLIGVPFIFQAIALGSMLTNHNSLIFIGAFSVMLALFCGLLFSWFYASATNLYKMLPASVPMNLSRFKIALFLPLTYILAMSVFVFGLFSNMEFGLKPNLAVFALIIPIHLLSMACIIYCLYFNAKALKAVELQAPVQFSDYIAEFFLFWFFPLGVWFIQPRLNDLFASKLART